jgi:hypothetical protein
MSAAKQSSRKSGRELGTHEDVYSRYGLHSRGVTKVTLSIEGFSRPSLRNCSDCHRPERQLPGGIRTHWKTVPLHGALQ